jgi:hypothetical protein
MTIDYPKAFWCISMKNLKCQYSYLIDDELRYAKPVQATGVTVI